MIRHSAGWLLESDLEREVPGRPDSHTLVRRCKKYLREQFTGEFRVAVSRSLEQKTKAELTAARVRASARGEDRRLAEANATIDRLLAFMPVRAQDIPPARLGEILSIIERKALAIFPRESSIVVRLSSEDETDTEACHRIDVTAYVPSSSDAASLADAIESLHETLADETTVDEYRAIRLNVEPWVRAAVE